MKRLACCGFEAPERPGLCPSQHSEHNDAIILIPPQVWLESNPGGEGSCEYVRVSLSTGSARRRLGTLSRDFTYECVDPDLDVSQERAQLRHPVVCKERMEKED